MRRQTRLFLAAVLILLACATAAPAGDFDWTRDFNIRAEGDPSGFRARLATRFKVGDARIDAVLSTVENPADAYIIFSLGEMSGRPPEYVVHEYHTGKGKGWGVLAKSLGIKPGSPEFHALKNGDNFYTGKDKGKKKKSKGKAKSKDKNKGKSKNKG